MQFKETIRAASGVINVWTLVTNQDYLLFWLTYSRYVMVNTVLGEQQNFLTTIDSVRYGHGCQQ